MPRDATTVRHRLRHASARAHMFGRDNGYPTHFELPAIILIVNTAVPENLSVSEVDYRVLIRTLTERRLAVLSSYKILSGAPAVLVTNGSDVASLKRREKKNFKKYNAKKKQLLASFGPNSVDDVLGCSSAVDATMTPLCLSGRPANTDIFLNNTSKRINRDIMKMDYFFIGRSKMDHVP